MKNEIMNVQFFLSLIGRVFTMPFVSLNIPEGVLFTDLVKRLKHHRCFHEKVS